MVPALGISAPMRDSKTNPPTAEQAHQRQAGVRDHLLWHRFLILVFHTDRELLSLIVYKAYDHGKPVIAARSGGLTETVIESVTGFLHEPGSTEQLADAVERLAALGSQGRAEMGQRGREWLVQNASPKEWRERFVGIVREAVR